MKNAATISISFKTFENILQKASLYIKNEDTKEKIEFDEIVQDEIRECLADDNHFEMSKMLNLSPAKFATVLEAIKHVTNIPVEGIAFVTEFEPTGLGYPMVHMFATINIGG